MIKSLLKYQNYSIGLTVVSIKDNRFISSNTTYDILDILKMNDEILFVLKDDTGYISTHSKNFFITRKEMRKNKIKKLRTICNYSKI